MTDPFPPAMPDFLRGGREMAKAIMARDWSKTALGPIESWPQSLRTTVSLCLASNFPISIAWGPQRVQIYNDGYWPICAAKHPYSMGQDFKECWFSAWPVIGEAFESAQRGETSYLENQRMFLDRNGYLEETFFTFSFSPVRDESGGIGGLFHPVTETTVRMLSERRTQALRRLGVRSAAAKSIEDACSVIITSLAESPLDLPFGLLYLLDKSAEPARLAGAFGLKRDAPDESGWLFHEALAGSEPLLLEDLEKRFGPLICLSYPEPVQKAFVLPIPAIGLGGWAAILVAGVSTRLPLDEAYRSFYDLLTSHAATTIANARAYEEERKRAEELAELDRAKTAFFSNVSHEFRTPLTLMLAPLEDLLARQDVTEPAKAELARMQRNALRLLKLVNTLLDFSRIEANRMQASYEPTDISHFTAELASAFHSAVERAGLQLAVDCPPLEEPIYVDREMWEKVVLNLVSNALKFTFEGSIHVTVALRGPNAELTVRDTGTGIAAADLPHVFERFHRIVGARARTHEGTGIGLALVQELVRLHGGSVTVASEPGRGTEFTVRIPRGKDHLSAGRILAERRQRSTAIGAASFVNEALEWLPEVADHSSPAPSPEPAYGGSVLLADDNADMREYLRRILAERYIVHPVPDGAEALEFARSMQVDLVLTDVMMPRMDGFELLRHLRADPQTRTIPVILLSARAGEESRVEGLEAGADDYLVKPFTVRELMARVDTHLRLSRVRREVAALHESEQRFRSMADCARLMMWTCDPALRCDYFNRGWLALTGRTVEEELAGDWTASVHWDDLPRLSAALEDAAARRASFELELRLLHHGGQYLWVFGAGAPRFLPGGEYLGYVFTCVDVDASKRAQQALEQSREQLQMALTATDQGLWDWNLQTGVCYFGPQYHKILGYEPGELEPVFDTWKRLLHADDRSMAAEGRPDLPGDGAFSRECRLGKKDGAYTWVLSKGSVTMWTPDGKPARIVGTITDITERRKLEEQFYQSQRLDSIGRLAGGVAHDFNNLLTVINGYAAMLATEFAGSEEAVDCVKEIRGAGERAAALTQQLLAFSRKQLLQPAVINLKAVVADVSKMLKRLIGENIELVLRLATDLGNITADPGQMQQIIMNLVVNSRDAMPQGGSVIIEAANAELDEAYVSRHPGIHSGRHVMLAITDTGTGMSPEVQERIFEPFFTTKSKGSGTGLGLAMVYGIVKQSGGWIWVYSEPGKGTTFKLYFPRTEQEVEPISQAAAASLRGTESILVVEDQEEVRALTVKALLRFGYTVYSAADGAEAVQFCLAHSGPLELVLTDVVMPGLSGREVGGEVSRLRPGTRILYMSGYTENAIAHHGVLDSNVHYIQKPFTPESLAAKVREVLDDGVGAAGGSAG